MPVNVQLVRTPGVGALPTPKQVEEALFSLCEKTVGELASLILEELHRNVSHVEVTPQAVDTFPVLSDLDSLLERYRLSFRVERTKTGAQLVIDRDELERQGLPRFLPEMLEYGSEVGISALAHLRPGWSRLLRETVRKLAREAMGALT